MIVFNTALSDFDRQGIEVYLDEKWALGLNLRTTYGAGNFNNDPASLLTPVPEPSSAILVGLGAMGMLARRKRG